MVQVIEIAIWSIGNVRPLVRGEKGERDKEPPLPTIEAVRSSPHKLVGTRETTNRKCLLEFSWSSLSQDLDVVAPLTFSAGPLR